MNTAVSSDQERTLSQMLRLVDLSLDLERNSDDRAFRDDGGKIIYVLDENIFEMFVRPWKHTESVETFYSDIWADNSEEQPGWRHYEAQAALIASELLVNRTLPGCRHQHILMTEAHRYELAHRVETLTKELRMLFKRDQKAVETAYANKIAQLEAVVAVSRGAAEPGQRGEVGGQLRRDLEKLAQSASQAVLDRVRVARRAASFLATDPVTEPLDQLGRITASEIRSRLRTLQHLRTAVGTDLDAIEKDADLWFERLVEELKKPGNRHRRRAEDIEVNPRAHAQALRNDARSIAYLYWFATRAIKTGERLVFITGDLVLFDAYRRWHADISVANGAAGPFFMRRATQYSPVFNPDDSATDLAGTRNQIFSQVEQAVEGALLPFVFASPDAAETALSSQHRREQLALKLIDLYTLADDAEVAAMLGSDPAVRVADYAASIKSIRSQWQEAERLAIGASYDLISARLSDEQLRLVRDIATQSPDEVAPALNRYVSRLFDRLVDDSMQLWLPLAETFGNDEDAGKRPMRRLRVAMVTAPPGPQSSSESIFAFAAARALELQDVSNAHRFAGLALRADIAARARGGGEDGADLELEYLNAVTYRFQIAAIGEHFRKDQGGENKLAAARAIDEVKIHFARASRLVHRAVAAHAEPHMDANSFPDGVRYMRALSERAALNLFMACSLGFARTPNKEDLAIDAQRHVTIAKGDLYWCIDIDKKLHGEDFILGRVRDQVGANLAAAEVLSYLLTRGKHYRFDERLMAERARIDAVRLRSADHHALLRAELMAFAILSGERIRFETRAGRPSFTERETLKLPLDRELFSAIVKRVL